MRRREFIVLLGGAAFWPIESFAQHGVPLVGLLGGRSAEADVHLLSALRVGLNAKGYSEGQNVKIVYRWAEGRYSLLRTLADELVSLGSNVIVATGGSAAAFAAKASTNTIPVAFSVGGDPVALGLVNSLSRPEGNLTGVSVYSAALDAKRLDLLHQLMPSARTIAVIFNSGNPSSADQIEQADAVIRGFGANLHLVAADSEQGIIEAFSRIDALAADALAIASDAFLIGQRDQIVALARARRLPTIYPVREFVDVGGLVSYGTDFSHMYRTLGEYVGQLLSGSLPSDLPIQQPTKFELMLNAKAAKELNLAIPASLLIGANAILNE